MIVRMAVIKNTTPNAGEDVGKEKRLFIAGGNGNLYNYNGNHYGSHSKN